MPLVRGLVQRGDALAGHAGGQRGRLCSLKPSLGTESLVIVWEGLPEYREIHLARYRVGGSLTILTQTDARISRFRLGRRVRFISHSWQLPS